MEDDDVLSVNEVCALYGITRQTFYAALLDGAPSVKEGRFRFVSGRAFRAWVEGKRMAWLHPSFEGCQERRRLGVAKAKDRIQASHVAYYETARERARERME